MTDLTRLRGLLERATEGPSDRPLIEAEDGPRTDKHHRNELGGGDWVTCRGCPSLRVFDWHYFYCRRLGDQSKSDEWNAGWKRLGDVTWRSPTEAVCGLPEVRGGPPPVSKAALANGGGE